MIGIQAVGVFVPEAIVDNADKASKFNFDEAFLTEKIGIKRISRKKADQKSSDLCVLSVEDLKKQVPLDLSLVDCVCVCTQNGDYTLPHTSAIVHEKLGLSENCAAFDIALGCSGYVYALHVMQSFMQANGLLSGLLFTSDPYSEIVDSEDKNTSLLFGDAATVTLLTQQPIFTLGKALFGTCGKKHQSLLKEADKPLYMNGREIFNFVMTHIPGLVDGCLKANSLSKDQVDLFLMHQASKYLIDKLSERAGLPKEKVPFVIQKYGNTVSSSIPMMLKDFLYEDNVNRLLICGFGVGLSMAASVLLREAK